SLIDAPIDATLTGRLGDDGRLGPVSGTLIAGRGGFVGAGGAALLPGGFEALHLAFDYDPMAERIALSRMEIEGEAGAAALAGFVDVERGLAGDLRGLAGQLAIAHARVDLPDLFAVPLAFDGGEVVARVGLAPATVEIATARLAQGALSLDLSGRLGLGPDGWQADLRAGARDLDIAGLKAFWPLPFAANARTWVVDHLQTGMIDALVAQVRTGRGEPQVSLDFRYRNLVSRYLDDMPAIREARGRGYLRLHEFGLEMDAGHVLPVEGAAIALGGSSVRISDLWAKRTPADILIRGRGPLGAILTLIDTPPLGLMRKLGLDPGTIDGEAEVETRLSFPLLKDLRLDEVVADSQATIHDLSMTLERRDGAPVAIAGPQVALTASTSEMTIIGDVTADGVPLGVDWREVYGTSPGRREVLARGAVTPGLLARFGATLPGFESGSADVVARLSQVGAEPPGISIEADLGAARLAIPDLGWSKAPGAPGRLEANARLGADGGAEIARLRIEAPGLAADGSLTLDAAGDVTRAVFERFRLEERADLGFSATRLGASGLALTLRGRRLDLGAFDEALTGGAHDTADDTAPDARPAQRQLAVDFDIADLALTPTMAIHAARGRGSSQPDGSIEVEIDGALNGEADVSATLDLPADGPGRLVLSAPDAGAFLRATGLVETARDGTLTLEARLDDGGFDRLSGVVKMSNITLREARTVEGILNRGGVVQNMTGGLAFSDVRIPFTYADGIITLGTTVATGPALAVKLDGTIDEQSGALDLSGVISPAYALTGVLDNIPLLGALLSGGKGEGILAMTFAVDGTIDDPSYTVNPLSLLTPGILRRIFTSKTRNPDEQFLDNLQRTE
ncbi:MAG: AsmA-like C-terminal domain-containing protein, partial [Thermohalobaculum sp.]|nr:AsmA-like C-terminal domain-containing protein [Thermohalobaculum sp.]